ncbi:hypothetical protein [Rivularia sp. PCC 7116]|nr:hypothetical protein [Rivularia sp. PCC 7116]
MATKPVGKGSGLGLSILFDNIVQEYCRILGNNSTPEEDTEFMI